MRFPYIKLPSVDPSLKRIARPYIPVRISGSKGFWEGYGLIDSGADRSLFNIQIAEKIGLNLSRDEIELFSGIEGGALEASLQKVKVQIFGIDQEIEIMAGFVNSTGVAAILGQEGFFDCFSIKFERDRGIIEVNLAR